MAEREQTLEREQGEEAQKDRAIGVHSETGVSKDQDDRQINLTLELEVKIKFQQLLAKTILSLVLIGLLIVTPIIGYLYFFTSVATIPTLMAIWSAPLAIASGLAAVYVVTPELFNW